jgi:hypothetical protein
LWVKFEPYFMPNITQTKSPTHDEVAKIASALYEERGREEGHDVEDWLAAEAHASTDDQHSISAAAPPQERP